MQSLPFRVLAPFVVLCLPYVGLAMWLERVKGSQSLAAFVAVSYTHLTYRPFSRADRPFHSARRGHARGFRALGADPPGCRSPKMF